MKRLLIHSLIICSCINLFAQVKFGSGYPSTTPKNIGDEYFDTTGLSWFKSLGTTTNDWRNLEDLSSSKYIKVKNPPFYAKGDGVSDDTPAFQAALAKAGETGTALYVPAGVYVLSNLVVNTGLSMYLDSGATLLAAPNSVGPMISYVSTNLLIEGGTIDGNKANQIRYVHVIAGDVPEGCSIIIRNVNVRNTVMSLLWATDFGGLIDITGCQFSGQKEGGLANDQVSFLAYVMSGEIGKKGLMRFNHNTAYATVPAALDGGSPGGVFFCCRTNSLADPPAGNFSTFEAIGNKFYGYGQNIGIHDISPLHFYPACGGARIIGNYFEQCGFCAISAKSVMDCVISGNIIVNGQMTTKNIATEGAISYVPGYMAETNMRPRAVITGNIVSNPGGQTGSGYQACISVHGNNAGSAYGDTNSYASQWVVANNVLSGGGRGLHVDYAENGVIDGNLIIGGTNGAAGADIGLIFYHCRGSIRISNNHIITANGHGILGTTSLTNANFDVVGNRFDHSAAGTYACALRGPKFLYYSGNIFNVTAGTGVSWGTDIDGNPIGAVSWDDSNMFEAGGLSINWTAVGKFYGAVKAANSPVGVVTPGEIGTKYLQTNNSTLWISTGTGVSNWTPVVMYDYALSQLRAGTSAGNVTATDSTFLGRFSGQYASNASIANLYGYCAGQYATNATNSLLIGYCAGRYAAEARETLFLGYRAGQYATNAFRANLIGLFAGESAFNAYHSFMVGFNAGQFASAATYAIFQGYQAGMNSTNANRSIFIGYEAGKDVNKGRTLILDPKGSMGTNALVYGDGDNSLLRVHGTFHPDALVITNALTAPADAATVIGWVPINLNGTNAFMPIYK